MDPLLLTFGMRMGMAMDMASRIARTSTNGSGRRKIDSTMMIAVRGVGCPRKNLSGTCATKTPR